jgi:hydroxymethylbilane synthase
LEEALLDRRVDLVVHSLKDLPTDLPDGLVLAAVLDREDARDVLVSNNKMSLRDLSPGSKVATSSRRRSAQLKYLRSDLEFVDIRGNIPTRLRKHDEGLCDAMVLAAAGLIRLGVQDRITEYLDYKTSTPAAGQGALAVECRRDDDTVLKLAAAIDDIRVSAEVTAERRFLEQLGGGCSVPIGVVAETIDQGRLRILGCVASADGKHLIRSQVEGESKDATNLGIDLANIMLGLGAADLLEHLKNIPVTISPP